MLFSPVLAVTSAHETGAVERPVRLANLDCAIGGPLCFGAERSPAAAIGADFGAVNPINDLMRFFIGNGTPDRPDGGLLIGDGYSFSDNDVDVTPYCVAGEPCNGGNAGLLIGKGGNGYNGHGTNGSGHQQ